MDLTATGKEEKGDSVDEVAVAAQGVSGLQEKLKSCESVSVSIDVPGVSEATAEPSSSCGEDAVRNSEPAISSEPAASTGNDEDENSLMPNEQLYSDDSDTAGYYEVSASSFTNRSSSAEPDNPSSYQRGILSSSSDDSMDDDSSMFSDSSGSSSELSDDVREEISSLNIDVSLVKVPSNMIINSQNRMMGDFGGCCGHNRYTQRMRCNLNFVRRLRVAKNFEGHNGCVNALNFNSSGTWLASGSDDTKVYIWDVSTGKPYMNFNSGHDSNVFQTKFMPHSNDSQIVTCSRDGKVRLAELSTSGSCRSTKKLAQHSGAAHKLAVEKDSPHCLLSAGEDSVVFQIDLRERRPTRLVSTMQGRRRVVLYSVDKHPHNQYEFIVGGKDHHVRVYDKRKIDCDDGQEGVLKKFYPHEFDNIRGMRKDITAAVYSFDGSEIIASYNDGDIYLFNSSHSDGADSSASYSGHRNSATIKGVNFFGPCSEYIVSGSDCGYVYIWDKATRQIVQIQRGDEGVVNVLEPHPIFPYLAVSGLAHDVKLLMPIGKELTDVSKYKKVIKRNKKHRRMDSFLVSAALDRQIYISAMGLQRRRRQAAEDLDISDSDDDGPRNMQCTTS